MKADDFRALTPQELDGRIADMQKQLFNLHMQLHSSQLANTNKLRNTRRDIAKALTVRREMDSKAGSET